MMRRSQTSDSHMSHYLLNPESASFRDEHPSPLVVTQLPSSARLPPALKGGWLINDLDKLYIKEVEMGC